MFTLIIYIVLVFFAAVFWGMIRTIHNQKKRFNHEYLELTQKHLALNETKSVNDSKIKLNNSLEHQLSTANFEIQKQLLELDESLLEVIKNKPKK